MYEAESVTSVVGLGLMLAPVSFRASTPWFQTF